MRKFLIFSAVIFLAGCAQNMEMQLSSLRSSYESGQYVAAAKSFTKNKTDFSSLNNLELLITADSLFQSDDYTKSDLAYEEFNHRNTNLTGGDIGRETTMLIAGNLANEYRPFMMDSLFVSYYQLWNALAQDRYADARVIINQSYLHQQEMSVAYEKLIEKTKELSLKNSQLADNLNDENSKWLSFRNIMNPALTYLAGLYFLNTGDFSQAKTYLSRASGMVPENTYIKRDLEIAKMNKKPTNTVWIFIEQDFAPKLREVRLDIPFFTSDGMAIIPLAISEPEFSTGTVKFKSAELLADVDALFMTEYETYRINEVMRQWASAVAKTALQVSTNAMVANGNNGAFPLIGFATNLYSVGTSNAEVRTWATLPKTIYLIREKNDGLIELKSNANLATQIKLPSDKSNYLIYVRRAGEMGDVKIIKLK